MIQIFSFFSKSFGGNRFDLLGFCCCGHGGNVECSSSSIYNAGVIRSEFEVPADAFSSDLFPIVVVVLVWWQSFSGGFEDCMQGKRCEIKKLLRRQLCLCRCRQRSNGLSTLLLSFSLCFFSSDVDSHCFYLFFLLVICLLIGIFIVKIKKNAFFVIRCLLNY